MRDVFSADVMATMTHLAMQPVAPSSVFRAAPYVLGFAAPAL